MKSFKLVFKHPEAQFPITPLSQEHLNLVNSAMNGHSKTKRWHTLLQTDELVSIVLSDVLFCVSTTLQSTSIHNHIVAPNAIRSLGVLDQQLSNKEKAELRIALRRASEHGNWGEIIMHCLSLFLLFSWCEPLISNHTVLLQKPSSTSPRQPIVLNAKVQSEWLSLRVTCRAFWLVYVQGQVNLLLFLFFTFLITHISYHKRSEQRI